MHIKLNGKHEVAAEEHNIFDFLLARYLNPLRLKIECNGRLLEHKDWPTVNLRDGDTITVIAA